jgi:hypothetical protein
MSEPSNEPRRQISTERKALYYAGMALMALGIVLFVSTFFTFAANFGNFEFNPGTLFIRALIGMVLLVVGGLVMRLGAAGAAGSGLLLDPEKARKDVEPWTRMAGGMTSDMLSEVDVVQKVATGLAGKADQRASVKIRCRQCKALNDEAAKYCDQCGAEL